MTSQHFKSDNVGQTQESSYEETRRVEKERERQKRKERDRER